MALVLRLIGTGFLLFCLGAAQAAPASAAATPAQQVAARHKALVATFNRGDLKALRGFYAETYTNQGAGGRKVGKKEFFAQLEALKAAGMRLQVRATLSEVRAKGDAVSLVETATLEAVSPAGEKDSHPSKMRQQWRRVKGQWVLTAESEIP